MIQIKNGIKTCQCECKNYSAYKKDNSWSPSKCICENSKYKKGIVDDSVIAYDEIVYVMDIVSAEMTNTIPTNVKNTMLTNSDDKKVRHKINCYILHTVLFDHITIIPIICYLYGKHWSKQKGIDAQTI